MPIARPPSIPVATGADGFERFYRRNYRPVVALAGALTGRREVGEEVAQEAFSAAWDRWDEVAGFEDPDAWVRRVAANKAVSQFRRSIRYREKLRLLRAGASTQLDPYRAPVWDEVRRLPRRQQHVIALHYLEDLPVADIAETLECSQSAVKTHLRRARGTLATRLGETEAGR